MAPITSKPGAVNANGTERSEELPFRSLVERVPAIVYVDPAGPEPTAPTYVSPFITQMLGYSPGEATGGGGWWSSILHPDDRERVLAEWTRSDETGEPYAGEY